MSKRIVKGYWDCEACGTKEIDGLADICPGCGSRKPENTKYYLKEKKEYISSEELKKAGISEEECDGNHKEWVCPYCDKLNNYADAFCVGCGAPKSESTKEYGEKQSGNTEDAAINEISTKLPNTPISYDNNKNGEPNNKLHFSFMHLIPVLLTAITVFLITFLLWPVKEVATVTGFSWARSITVEEERTVRESDWDVPNGGRVYEEKQEFYGYTPVLDHYETVTETKSREVFDHNDVTYTYEDNGNGTFTEISHETPVYRTEYYTETHDEPVYRQEPVYATKYYYEIDRWFDTEKYKSSGNDKKPYWNTSYSLASNERDTKRWEEYSILYDDEQSFNVDYNTWMETDLEDKMVVTKCRLGITYSVNHPAP